MRQLNLFEGIQRFHPVYGYDLEAVPKVRCLHCGEPIGDEEYVEVTLLARFGQMFFLHKRCDSELSSEA